MRRSTMMMLALVAMTTGLTVNADEVQTTSAPVVEAAATKLSAEEISFAAKLNDQNRKAFSEKLSADQRRAVMVAGKNGANPDEAVQRMVASKEMKDSSVVVNEEDAELDLQ
jgi:hypothetical protein